MVGGLLALVGGGPALSTPAVVAGWPVPAPAGQVHAAPGGQPLVISGSNAYLFSSQGISIWSALRTPSCGNCDESPAAPNVQPDGTYGPFGAPGDFWALDPTGQFIAACVGVVLSDGTCIAADPSPAATVRATRAGTTLWVFTEPNVVLDTAGTPKVVAGGEGEVFVLFDPGREVPSEREVRYRVVSIDTATGARKWSTDLLKSGVEQITFSNSGGQVLAPRPGGGVLVQALGQMVALDRAGAFVWKYRVAGSPRVESDPSGLIAMLNGDSVEALDASSGAQRFVVDGLDLQQLLSRGSSGTLYVGGERAGIPELAAYWPDGGLKWTYPTALPVAGARESTDGTVVVSTGYPGRFDGLLTRIDPTKVAPGTRKPRIGVTRRSFSVGRGPASSASRRAGTIVKIMSPSARQVTISIEDLRGRRYRGLPASLYAGRVPAGMSHVRVLAGTAARPGRAQLVVRLVGSRPQLARFKVRLTR